ncbi:MAG: hypothetical protein AAFV93_16695 [Chloroflexota bacterium]
MVKVKIERNKPRTGQANHDKNIIITTFSEVLMLSSETELENYENIDKISKELKYSLPEHVLQILHSFVLPNEKELETLLDTSEIYREYTLVLANMQDYLLYDAQYHLRPRGQKVDSKTYIQNAIANELLTPLVDNLVKNQAIVLRLSELAKEEKSEKVSTLINNYLDSMADFLNYFREAKRNNDKTIIAKYIQVERTLSYILTVQLSELELDIVDE